MLSLIKKSGYQLKMSDLTTIGIGHLVGCLLPKTGDVAVDLSQHLPYTQALLSYTRDGLVDSERMRELRAGMRSQVRLIDATWDDLPVEEVVVRAASSMHDAWRQLNRPSQRDPQWYLRLPLAFIGWNQARMYCGLMIPVVECLGVTDLNDDLLCRAYYEYAANDLYKYGLDEAQGLTQAMRVVAALPSATGLAPEDSDALLDSKFVSKHLRRQLENYGIGTFARMRQLAETFSELMLPDDEHPDRPRSEVNAEILRRARAVA